jgi:hypothetical protein
MGRDGERWFLKQKGRKPGIREKDTRRKKLNILS